MTEQHHLPSSHVEADRLNTHRMDHHLSWFERFARVCSTTMGKPAAFLAAAAIVLVWLVTGPVFGFSDTWQLVINTGTTIITFLMVFLLQHSQNRDTLALQIKLADLIIAVRGAKNELATAEDLSDRELAELHKHYALKAQQTLKRLEAKRTTRPKAPAAPAAEVQPPHA
jgi:low affinity Fe/Cu permease